MKKNSRVFGELLRQSQLMALGKTAVQQDVVIVGAGAAGLACGDILSRAGLRCLVLEARPRIGGRVWTRPLPGGDFVELGAEFMHGASPEVLEILRRERQAFFDLCDRHLFFRKGRLSETKDFWGKLEVISKAMNAKRKKDRSVEDFLDSHSRRGTAEARRLFEAYVEGFHAADLSLAGERGIALAEGAEESELNSQSQFRPREGQKVLIEGLWRQARRQGLNLHLKTIVEKVRWSSTGIVLETRQAQNGRKSLFRAGRVVMTLPLAVLKNFVFDPPLPALMRTLEPLQMGHVQRLTFQFSERFWENLSAHPVGFLHGGPGLFFPTWWTQMPLRSPFLTAWQGGPKALEMSSWSRQERITEALRSLSHLGGRSEAFLRRKLVRVFTHDWSGDPFSLGAYSYLGVQNSRTEWRAPGGFEDRLFVAGEAFASPAERGTVAGAIHSGRRTARLILRGS